jgi:hydrogenase expression/formation protein HypC
MCLGLPGKVVDWIDRDPLFARAEIDFGGVRKVCHMACVPEAETGDYVVVHAGIAISRVQPPDANLQSELNASVIQSGGADQLPIDQV